MNIGFTESVKDHFLFLCDSDFSSIDPCSLPAHADIVARSGMLISSTEISTSGATVSDLSQFFPEGGTSTKIDDAHHSQGEDSITTTYSTASRKVFMIRVLCPLCQLTRVSFHSDPRCKIMFPETVGAECQQKISEGYRPSP